VASLYQIKDFGPQNALLLSEWIYENYKYEQLETVIECLRAPNSSGDKIWRLTPDTINDWISRSIDRLSEQREREIHNAKHEKVESEWPQERLQELQEVIKAVEDFKVPAITEDDILEEGQEKPKRKYVPPDKEYLVMLEMKREYGRKWCHLHTGRPLPGAPSFEEFLALNQ